jgi:hypothetical protein
MPRAAHASGYAGIIASWRRDPEVFWGEVACGIDWNYPPRGHSDSAFRP